MTPAVREALARYSAAKLGLQPPSEAALDRAAAAAVLAGSLRDEDELCLRLASGDPAVERVFVAAVTVRETYFFRHPVHFDALAAHLRGLAAAGRRPLRLWSAGCATGEEAWSMAAVAVGAAGASVQVRATDLNAAAIEHARRGVFSARAFRGGRAPDPRLFEPCDGGWRALPVLRERVTFAAANLCAPALPPLVGFDAVFCRNVLLYLDARALAAAAEVLASALAPTGRLWTAATDPVLKHPALRVQWSEAGPVYQRAEEETASAEVPPATAPPAPAPPRSEPPPRADFGAYLERAMARLDRGDLDGASADAQKALVLRPRSAAAQAIAAMVAQRAGDDFEQRRRARIALALLRGGAAEAQLALAGHDAATLAALCERLACGRAP